MTKKKKKAVKLSDNKQYLYAAVYTLNAKDGSSIEAIHLDTLAISPDVALWRFKSKPIGTLLRITKFRIKELPGSADARRVNEAIKTLETNK